jgi:hypothetical protein
MVLGIGGQYAFPQRSCIMVDITDKYGKWRLTYCQIEKLETGEIRRLKQMPCTNTIAVMPLAEYMRKMEIAFNTGEWPMTEWKSGVFTY